ncbi:hypothetical protein TWF718_006016 [Orbilia javanica]|uniref:Uncharacterized protein n=1 Tax=Orbilia javanica TaxID=47235 RepID=A0AAN8REM2_9PEZI
MTMASDDDVDGGLWRGVEVVLVALEIQKFRDSFFGQPVLGYKKLQPPANQRASLHHQLHTTALFNILVCATSTLVHDHFRYYTFRDNSTVITAIRKLKLTSLRLHLHNVAPSSRSSNVPQTTGHSNRSSLR